MRIAQVAPLKKSWSSGFGYRCLVTLWVLTCALSVSAAPRSIAPVSSSPTVRTITLAGNDTVPTLQLMKKVSQKLGVPLDPNQVAFSVGALESVYRDKG